MTAKAEFLASLKAAMSAGTVDQSDILTALHERDDSLTREQKGSLIEEARIEHGDDEREIDDNALFSVGDDGVWVSGWFWIPRPPVEEADPEPEETGEGAFHPLYNPDGEREE